MLEPIILTGLTEASVGSAKVSELMPFLKIIGREWNLNISRVKDFQIAKRILINSLKNN